MRYFILSFFLLCSACAGKEQWPSVPAGSTLAVAHFVHPQQDWELMAGVLPEEASVIPPESLEALDNLLLSTLEKNGVRKVVAPAMVRQCEEIVLATKERKRFETVQYWKSVGECIKSDYLLVPYVTRWQEREGGEWGVTRAASLTVDIFLIETATGLSRRYHFEEEQKGLAENLLQGRRFIKRKGKWVTPMEIAAEAVDEGVRVLGL